MTQIVERYIDKQDTIHQFNILQTQLAVSRAILAMASGH